MTVFAYKPFKAVPAEAVAAETFAAELGDVAGGDPKPRRHRLSYGPPKGPGLNERGKENLPVAMAASSLGLNWALASEL